MSKKRFSGVMPALLTPLRPDGSVNRQSVTDLIEWQLAHGADGFYVCGSTGEGPVLPSAVRMDMLETAIAAVHGRAPVIAHVGAIDSAEAMSLARHASQAGADGISSVPPNFYFDYQADEIIDYYERLAGQSDLPLLLYAVPRLAYLDINGIVSRLLAVPNIVGLKDTRAQYYNLWKLSQLNGGDINIINGPDEMLICGLMMGADGGIGSTYNIMMPWYADLYRRFRQGDLDGARQCQTRINRVIDILLKWGCLRALKAYLTLNGFDMGHTAYPQRQLTPDEAKALKAEIDPLFSMEL